MAANGVTAAAASGGVCCHDHLFPRAQDGARAAPAATVVAA